MLSSECIETQKCCRAYTHIHMHIHTHTAVLYPIYRMHKSTCDNPEPLLYRNSFVLSTNLKPEHKSHRLTNLAIKNGENLCLHYKSRAIHFGGPLRRDGLANLQRGPEERSANLCEAKTCGVEETNLGKVCRTQ